MIVKYIMKIAILMCVLLAISGCNKNIPSTSYDQTDTDLQISEPNTTPVNESVLEPDNKPVASPLTDPTAKAIETQVELEDTDKATLLDSAIAEAPVLSTGLMLKDIVSYMNLSDLEICASYENDFEEVRSHFNASSYTEFYNSELGIKLVCCPEVEEYYPVFVNYIELDKDKISFNGIHANMSFAEVMDILGYTEIFEIEDGLPGLISYEIRYQYNEILIRIYSYDRQGENGIYMSLVNDFQPEYRNIRIMPEQISEYFEMSMDELTNSIGEGEQDGRWPGRISYLNYDVTFWFNEAGEHLNSICLGQQYLINELRQAISLEETMDIMGKRKVEVIFDEDTGPTYWIEYEFDDFMITVYRNPENGWGTEWIIESK